MANEPDLWHFADCDLDLAARELRVGGSERAIEPKAFDLLAYLLNHRERVVSHDELMDAIWPGVIVTEAALARTVMKARKAVDDGAGQQAVIRTVPKRGYRFVAELDNDGLRPGTSGPAEPEDLSPVQFARSGGVHVAWRSLGSGSPAILFVPGFVSHLDNRYKVPSLIRFEERLARKNRLVTFDKRGMGLSERVSYPPTVENTVADMVAVLDAAGIDQAVLFGVSEGGPATALFATTQPARTRGVIMYGAFAKGLRSKDYPWARPRKLFDAWLDEFIGAWGSPASLEYFAPNLAQDPEARAEWSHYLRNAATPASVRGVLEALRDIDVRDILPQIDVPTLVLHRRGDRIARWEAGEDIAERIPGARFKLLEGDDHWWFIGDSESILEEIESFLASLPPR
ncbi:MAG: alpha/beta fold hydrolase [Chromatiales bacterium]|nr:MAG: alpha/beta fold hydrolase [Chromatiales bacterium]